MPLGEAAFGWLRICLIRGTPLRIFLGFSSQDPTWRSPTLWTLGRKMRPESREMWKRRFFGDDHPPGQSLLSSAGQDVGLNRKALPMPGFGLVMHLSSSRITSLIESK